MEEGTRDWTLTFRTPCRDRSPPLHRPPLRNGTDQSEAVLGVQPQSGDALLALLRDGDRAARRSVLRLASSFANAAVHAARAGALVLGIDAGQAEGAH